MQTFLSLVGIFISLLVIYFSYKYYHDPIVEIKLRTKRLKVFNEKYKIKTFWTMILAPVLTLTIVQDIKNIFLLFFSATIIMISFLTIIWYMRGHDHKCEKCKYIWGYLKNNQKVRDVVTDLDKTNYDSPGQVSRLGRTEEKYQEYKVLNICRFCNFKKIELKSNEWMLHVGNLISKIGRK